MVCVARHLEHDCSESGLSSTEQRMIERKNKKEKHEEEVVMKIDQCQEEAACTDSKRKIAGGT